ncbi:MAG TPA: T9SS type A sorting domain-containing protein, partial [Flavitalea sp.]|nr:T9SS type A sorting domain-containing protein [Flavitalea sp.]
TSLWLRPDHGISDNTDGTSVETWVDFGNEVNNASQTNAGIQPVFKTNATDNINYNPVVTFNGTNQFMNLDVTRLPVGTTPRTIIGVGALNNTTGNRYVVSWGTAGASTGMGLANVSGAGYLVGYGDDVVTTAGFWQVNTPNELFGTWAGAGGQANLYSKMQAVSAPVNKAWNTGTTGAVIGKSVWGGDLWSGPVSEVIAFDRVLTANERQRISTYLAIRNGYTLNPASPVDYLSTNSSVVWNTIVNTGYNNNIAGIGRDDVEGLEQKQSKSIQSGAIVAVGLGSIATDNMSNANSFQNDMSYVIWGSNSTALTTLNGDLPDGYCYSQRLTQEWKTSLKNFDNQLMPLSMKFDLNGITYSGTDVTHFVLLIDNDGNGNFTDGTVQQVQATSYDNTSKTVTFDNIVSLVDGAVFTLVTKAPEAVTATLTAYAVNSTSSNICTNSGWILFKDPADVNKYIAAIYDPNSLIDKSKITVTVNATSALNDLGKGVIQRGSRVMRRMLQVNCNACFDALANPNPGFTVRMFYSEAEKTAAENSETNNLESIKTANSIVGINQFRWFKYSGDVSDVITAITEAGVTSATEWNEGILMTGNVDGESYVDFASIDAFSTFGGFWTVQNDILLAAKFLRFNASKSGDKVVVSWRTGNETNVKGDYIERSEDGNAWAKIGFVNALPVALENDYSFTDHHPLSGNNYYRIVEVDYDGVGTYSSIRLVAMDGVASFAAIVYPVPVKDLLQIKIESVVNAKAELRIIDASGRTIMKKAVQLRTRGNIATMNVDNIKRGVYAVELSGVDFKWSAKFVKE